MLKPRPLAPYLKWLRLVPRSEQHTSAVVVAEFFVGAFRSPAKERHLENIRRKVLPALTVIPFDEAVAEEYGSLRAELEERGQRLAEADLQIAAAALVHGHILATGNIRHFACVPGLSIEPALAEARGLAR